NGCHLRASGLTHGREEAFDSAWAGAATAGVSYYPSTVDALPVGDIGQTMAEVRAQLSCAQTANQCASIEPSVNLVYDDVWTDLVKSGRAPDESFSYPYVSADPDNPGLSTALPVDPTCVPPTSSWSANCRIVVNYEENVHPLWSVIRPELDDLGMQVFDQNGQPVTNTCTNCHNIVDPAAATIVPAGQLDLSDGASDLEADHFKAYRELLSADEALTLDANGNLITLQQEVGIDPDTGDPILQPVTVAPSMSVVGANNSNAFFAPFEAGASHEGYLSDAELRLISEWLDVGAQYYNNPFDAPIN
ncbi:MAG: hypothetical protein AAGA44_17990, partial [Pseudomonadota bacterium]